MGKPAKVENTYSGNYTGRYKGPRTPRNTIRTTPPYKSLNSKIEDAKFYCGHHDNVARSEQSSETIAGNDIHIYKVGMCIGITIHDGILPDGS